MTEGVCFFKGRGVKDGVLHRWEPKRYMLQIQYVCMRRWRRSYREGGGGGTRIWGNLVRQSGRRVRS